MVQTFTLAGTAVPIILLGVYYPHLAFPLFGSVRIPELYLALIIFMIPIMGNAINSIDVLNGVASGFMTIASFALTVCLVIVHNYDIALASLPLGFVSLAFYKYHKVPSRIFPGDSGALTLGAMYGTIAIVGHVEVIAAVALLPAVINSFLFLSSVKRVIEHRQIKAKPVIHTEDFRLMASDDKSAPVTLVRLILSNGPLTEKQVGFVIFRLALFSAALAIITDFYDGGKNMRGKHIFFYIFVMWALIIGGGGLLVSIIAPLSIHGFGKFDHIVDSIVKSVIAMILVVLWVLLMSKIKNWIFQKQMSY